MSKAYKAQVIVMIHFPTSRQSTTYGESFGEIAKMYLNSNNKSVEKNFFDLCNAADKGT